MTEVEKWMLKHYTQDLDSMKCNYCQEIFSNCNRMQNFKYHLRNMHNVLELDEHSECDNIQKNYKISNLMATCNHCKKTINLAIHGVHVLTIHLKIFHSDKSKIKKPHPWNKYDITDNNNATCKGCKKTINISKPHTAASNLYHHLHCCPHFKIYFPPKKKITFEIARKKSHPWDKYDITDNNNATCKGCKKTLQIKITTPHATGCLRKHLHYCPHFKIDFPLKKEITYEIKRKKHPWDKYDITDNNNATCKGCKKTLKIKVTSINAAGCLGRHLHYCPHFKTDFPPKKKITFEIARKIKSHPWDKYNITDNNNVTCKGCKKTLKIKITTPHATGNLRRHLHYCPHFKTDFPPKKKITFEIARKKSHPWDKYDITDNNNATCKGCKKTLQIKITTPHATGCLRRHLHYCPHFKTDFPLNKEIIRKKSHLWNKYDITDNNNATCKGCKKTLKIKITTPHATGCLGNHLHYCPHFKIDFPLKKEVTFEITRKKSDVWNKYDIIDNNNATCKGCKKTLKVKVTSINATTCLRRHLQHYCPHFKIDFLPKKKITFEIARKKSHPWDKYDITDNNNATCKGCKKTLKKKVTSINAASCLRSHLHYCPYFKTDFPRKKEITNHMEKKKTSRVWDRYYVMGSYATCKGCKKTIKIARTCAVTTLLRHLRYCSHFRNDFPNKKLKKITHMRRVQCNRQQCEVKDVKRKKNNKNKN